MASALPRTDLDAPLATTGPRRRGWVLITPSGFAAATLAIVTFIVCFVTPADYDYWWHLADGRYIVANHHLPSPDVFSFTVAGRAYVAHEWLSEAVMYGLHQGVGMRGPVALFAFCMVTVALLTFLTLRRLGVRLSLTVALVWLMLAAMHMFTGPRPQVAGFALLAAEIWVVERWIVEQDRSIWALPVLVWLWGNLHGSFAVGLALPLAILVSEHIASWLDWKSAARLEKRQRIQLAAAVAASVLLLPFNPNGWHILLYPLSKLNDPIARQYLGEWAATDISNPLYWPFALLAGGYAALVAVRRPHVLASDLLLALGAIAAALTSAKYVPIAAIVLVPLIGRLLGQRSDGTLHLPNLLTRFCMRRNPTQALYLLELLVLLAAAAVTVRRIDPMTAARTRVPVAAVDALGPGGLRGPLFNDYSWGGYLIWRLWPQARVFIDGRGDDLYLKGGELRGYFDAVTLQTSPDGLLDRYRIQTVLIPEDSALTRYLLAGGGWQATYNDGNAVKLERGGTPGCVDSRRPCASQQR